jgi:hypothetical protein
MKEQFRQRLLRWRPPWYYWLKFALAWCAVMALFFFVIIPVVSVEWVLGRVGINIDCVTLTEDWINVAAIAQWGIDTLDLYLDSKKHQQFFLSLYEE